MQLHFQKYHGAGNDFILLDNRDQEITLSKTQIAFLCHRRFGIGADGLMLLENARGVDFKMVYYNSDGAESSMCGNGGRCITAFAKALGIIGDKASFIAVDGPHESSISADGMVRLRMNDVSDIRLFPDYALLDTGSPHYVQWMDETAGMDVVGLGRNIRNLPRFAPGGLNVNFTKRLTENHLEVRTYERGVEDETMSCGTGVTAAAIASSAAALGDFKINITTPGGDLQVYFTKNTPHSAIFVTLHGPAVFIYSGIIELERGGDE